MTTPPHLGFFGDRIKCNYACGTCRTTSKQPGRSTPACPQCGEVMVNLGRNARIEPRRKDRYWQWVLDFQQWTRLPDGVRPAKSPMPPWSDHPRAKAERKERTRRRRKTPTAHAS